jgi:site-specific DNA recombinase
MTSRVAIYARVSTPNQTKTQTIEQQLQRLQTHVKQQGWELRTKHIFRDDGRSGADLKRTGLDQLRDAVKYGEIDRIIATEPDRLARNYVHQMILLEEFEKSGCRIEFLDRPMSDDPHDRLLLQIRSAVAEYERTLVTERMRRGRYAKYRAGTLLPWTRPPYGYRVDPDRPRDPTGVWVEASEAAIVQMIYEFYGQMGSSLCGLANHLNKQQIPTPSGKQIWGLATLRNILKRPDYTGKVYACRFRYREPKIRRSATHKIGNHHQSYEEVPPEEWIFVGTIPAIITQEQFDIIQGKLKQNKSFAMRNNKTHQYLLRALVSCGVCQSACVGRTVEKGKYRYYVCSGKAKPIHSRRLEKCPSRFAPASQLDDIVWQDLCHVLTHVNSLTLALERAQGGQWLPQELQAQRATLQQAKRTLDSQLERLTDAYLAAVVPLAEYERRRGDIEKRLTGLMNQEETLMAQVNQHAQAAQRIESVKAFAERISPTLEDATFEQKRQLVELLIDRVVVTNDDVDIRYAIPLTPESEQVRFCHLRSDYRYHICTYRRRLAVPGTYSGPVFADGRWLGDGRLPRPPSDSESSEDGTGLAPSSRRVSTSLGPRWPVCQ